MSDWEIDNSQDSGTSFQKITNPADWEMVSEESNPASEKEGLAYSLGAAIPRIASDLGGAAMRGLNALPGYFEKAKTEVPALLSPFSQMKKHPFHQTGQALAGANELINSVAQFPLDLSKYGSDRLHLLPQGVTNFLQKITPEDTTEAINQLFGQPKYAGEAALRGGIRNSPLLYGAGKLASAIKPSALLTTKKSIKNNILNTHDALEGRASETFKKVSDEVNNRGAIQVPLTNAQGAPVVDFNNLKSYFPSTKQYNSLLTKSQTGDYNALRKLQTNLYEQGKKNLGSGFEADRMKGAEMLESRNDINQAISDHLVNSGNTDLADLLQGARTDWSTLQKTYYNENMNNALVNMVNKKYRKIPNNLIDLLGEDSIPMKNLLDFHPGLATKISGYKTGQNILGKGLKYGVPLGAAYLGYEYGKPKG